MAISSARPSDDSTVEAISLSTASPAADLHVEHPLGPAEGVAHVLDDGVLVPGDIGQHERLVAVVAPQRWRPAQRPVRLDLGDVGPFRERVGERGSVGGRPGVVDAAGRRSGQQDEVGCAGVEARFEGVGGAGALRVGILEATIFQHAERARTEGPAAHRNTPLRTRTSRR